MFISLALLLRVARFKYFTCRARNDWTHKHYHKKPKKIYITAQIRLKGRMTYEQWDLKYAEQRLIGSDKLGRTMIRLEQWCHWVRQSWEKEAKNSSAVIHPGKHADEWFQIFLLGFLHELRMNEYIRQIKTLECSERDLFNFVCFWCSYGCCVVLSLGLFVVLWLILV